MEEAEHILTLPTGALVAVVAKLNTELDDHPHSDGDQAGASNAGHDLLNVGDIVDTSNQKRSTTEEGVLAGGIHHGVLLAGLDGGTSIAHTTSKLLDGQGLSGKGSLVYL